MPKKQQIHAVTDGWQTAPLPDSVDFWSYVTENIGSKGRNLFNLAFEWHAMEENFWHNATTRYLH